MEAEDGDEEMDVGGLEGLQLGDADEDEGDYEDVDDSGEDSSGEEEEGGAQVLGASAGR